MSKGKTKMRGLAALCGMAAFAAMLSVAPAIALDASPATPSPARAEAAALSRWETAPRMQAEQEFAGPIADTMIHRWRDPDNGTLCYVYAPISANLGPGITAIGSISCIPNAVTPVVTAAP